MNEYYQYNILTDTFTDLLTIKIPYRCFFYGFMYKIKVPQSLKNNKNGI